MIKITEKTFFRYILTATLVFALFLAVGCGSKDAADSEKTEAGGRGKKSELIVGYLPITHSLPLFIADEQNKDKFKNFDLKLQKFASWPELTEALNSGAIDGAVTMIELAMVAESKGLAQQLVALSHRNGDALVAVPDVKTVADLKGKTVAIPHRMSGHNILLSKALTDAGLKYSDVTVREMAPPDMPAALATGEVAAYIVAEPFGTQSILNGKARVLKTAGDIWPNWICCGLVVNSKVIEQNGTAVQELVGSLAAAGKFADQDREEAIKIAQKYTNIKAENWRESLKLTTYSDLVPKDDELSKVADYLMEMNLLEKASDIKKLNNTQFFENK